MDAIVEEQVEVLRIRLWNPERATALLAEFHAAERVLERWAGRSGSDAVGFEVTFADGRTISGSHKFFRGGKRKCLFSTHVRRLLHAPDPASAPH